MDHLQRLGQILFFVPLVMALSVEGLWAQKTVKAPAYEGTSAVGPDFVADATSGPPLQVRSTALVTNLNADFVNGLHSTAFAQLANPNTFSEPQSFVSNVGIGFTGASPEPLHVSRNGAGPTAVIEQVQSGQDSAIDFHSAGRLVGNVGVVFSDGNPRVFLGQNSSGVGPIPIALAENGGNVGIGLATPSNILTVKQGGGNVLADGYATYSSARWKTNVQTYRHALSVVTHLRGVSYNRKSDGKPEVGLIAEEVAKVVPEVVSFREGAAQGIDYSRLTALLVQAVKEQQEEIKQLKARLDKTGSQH